LRVDTRIKNLQELVLLQTLENLKLEAELTKLATEYSRENLEQLRQVAKILPTSQ